MVQALRREIAVCGQSGCICDALRPGVHAAEIDPKFNSNFSKKSAPALANRAARRPYHAPRAS
jgi:hypothetical protein